MSETLQENRAGGSGHFLHELWASLATQSSRTAILYKDSAVTYGELDARARRWAARLRQAGVETGDRVAIVTTAKLPFLACPSGDALCRGGLAAVESPVHRG